MLNYTHKLEYFKDKQEKWRFRFRAVNGRILCSSEAYSSLARARQGATGLVDGIKAKTLRAVTLEEERGRK